MFIVESQKSFCEIALDEKLNSNLTVSISGIKSTCGPRRLAGTSKLNHLSMASEFISADYHMQSVGLTKGTFERQFRRVARRVLIYL